MLNFILFLNLSAKNLKNYLTFFFYIIVYAVYILLKNFIKNLIKEVIMPRISDYHVEQMEKQGQSDWNEYCNDNSLNYDDLYDED